MDYGAHRCTCVGGITCMACTTWNKEHRIHMPHQRKASGRRTVQPACGRHARHNRRCPDCRDLARAVEDKDEF